MTLKEIYKDCTKKNRRFLMICLVFTLFWIVVTRDLPDRNITRATVSKYTVLVCCLFILVVMIICLVKNSRDFKLYQLIYDFKTIEKQMVEEETISIPELHLYFTKDYIVSVNGNLKILKRNSVIKIEETKIPVRRSEKCWYIFQAHQSMGEKTGFIQVLAQKNDTASEELMQVRNAVVTAFPGKYTVDF